jgi:hypothetical protein
MNRDTNLQISPFVMVSEKGRLIPSSLAIHDEIKWYVPYHFKTLRKILLDRIILPEVATRLGSES